VHKFICQGTLEQRIDALIDDKLALARDLVGEASGAEQTIAGMSDDELLDLVRLDMRALAGD
jgi:non-specific serine/threonine protein kinase